MKHKGWKAWFFERTNQQRSSGGVQTQDASLSVKRFPPLPIPYSLLPILLTACFPSSTPQNPDLRPLERSAYPRLLAPFKAELQTLGVAPRSAQGYSYKGDAPNAFSGALKQFYAQYAGFCPLEDGFFSAPDAAMYMTVAVKGKEVRTFIYDHSALPRFEYLFLEGSVGVALEGVCPRP